MSHNRSDTVVSLQKISRRSLKSSTMFNTMKQLILRSFVKTAHIGFLVMLAMIQCNGSNQDETYTVKRQCDYNSTDEKYWYFSEDCSEESRVLWKREEKLICEVTSTLIGNVTREVKIVSYTVMGRKWNRTGWLKPQDYDDKNKIMNFEVPENPNMFRKGPLAIAQQKKWEEHMQQFRKEFADDARGSQSSPRSSSSDMRSRTGTVAEQKLQYSRRDATQASKQGREGADRGDPTGAPPSRPRHSAVGKPDTYYRPASTRSNTPPPCKSRGSSRPNHANPKHGGGSESSPRHSSSKRPSQANTLAEWELQYSCKPEATQSPKKTREEFPRGAPTGPPPSLPSAVDRPASPRSKTPPARGLSKVVRSSRIPPPGRRNPRENPQAIPAATSNRPMTPQSSRASPRRPPSPNPEHAPQPVKGVRNPGQGSGGHPSPGRRIREPRRRPSYSEFIRPPKQYPRAPKRPGSIAKGKEILFRGLQAGLHERLETFFKSRDAAFKVLCQSLGPHDFVEICNYDGIMKPAEIVNMVLLDRFVDHFYERFKVVVP